MTHDTNEKTEESSGSERSVVHEINITELDSAGEEDYDPETETAVADAASVSVVGQEDADLLITPNADYTALNVNDLTGGAGADEGAAVGVVRLRVQGD